MIQQSISRMHTILSTTSALFKATKNLIILTVCNIILIFVLFYMASNQPKPMDELKRVKQISQKLDPLQKVLSMQMRDIKHMLEVLIKLDKVIKDRKERKKRREQMTEKEKAMQAVPDKHIPVGDQHALPVLVVACNRVTVKRALERLLKYRPSATKFPIIVSQDCGHNETAQVIQEFVMSHNISHIKQPDLSDLNKGLNLNFTKKRMFLLGYFNIARHYKWALDQMFLTFDFSAVIIVEDDLEISLDFYEYFSATLPILRKDPTLYCVSAWNDNGKKGLVSDEAELLYRTDFFPGLGWMLDRKLWMELRQEWPEGFWDDWIRHPATRRGRQCIRPEISRTKTFGKIGVSLGMFYDKWLKHFQLNDKYVHFSKLDLSYLEKANYDQMFARVYSAPLISEEVAKVGGLINETAVRVEYTDQKTFKKLAKLFQIMNDHKWGIPRTAYKGVVSFMFIGRRTFLTPSKSWSGYDIRWKK